VGNKIIPDANFNGELQVAVRVNDGILDSPSKNITLQVTAVNDPPVAVNDNYTIEQNASAVVLTVLDNDVEIDQNDSLTITQIDYSGSSTIENLSNSIKYTPASDFSGQESINYTITDQAGATSTASLSITVNGTPTITPPPTNSSGGGGSTSLFVLLMLVLYPKKRPV